MRARVCVLYSFLGEVIRGRCFTRKAWTNQTCGRNGNKLPEIVGVIGGLYGELLFTLA